MIEYVYSATEPTTESDSIDVSKNLALALVEYVKYKVAEDEGNERKADRYYSKFLVKMSEEADRRAGMPRKVIPAGTGVLR
jgi:hypothetical protein